MQELVFIYKNLDRWKQFEKAIEKKTQLPPDELAAMFIQIIDDLSYCRTFYPHTDTEKYLNELAGKVHYKIYRNKKESGSRILRFWTTDYPIILYQVRKYLIFSLILFFFFALIGAYSTAFDRNFLRSVVGDAYVDLTEYNIKNGNPLAIYKSMEQTEMFLAITYNNIMVSFKVFVAGFIFIIGTIYIMMTNGIMLGSFQYFFFTYGLFWESILTIWIHGTLEIFAITVASAAGLILGMSFLVPGTYKRLSSFMKGARTSLKIMLGLVPLFIVAGFLESFITRYTEAPYLIRAAIILASLIFIIWYFFLYPKKVVNRLKNHS